MSRLPDHSSRIICSDAHHPYPFKIEVAPGSLSFGNIVMNQSSIARQLVVTNVGSHPVRIGEIKTSGAFRATSNAPAYLNPGQNFLIDVFFLPRNEGISTGGVYVDTNDAHGTEYASLIGYGYVAGTDPGGGEGGTGGGVLPKYWAFIGDGETTSFPLDGADAYEKLLYDTYAEITPDAKDYVGINPVDFTIDPPSGGSVATIRFNVPLADGVNGYTILRGYAKPYTGPPPIDTVAPGVDTTIIENNTIIDRTKQNSILVVNSSTPITIKIRNQSGDDAKDWKNGEFFSVLQRGLGPVTLVMENPTGGELYPALDFIPRTRGVNCVISATCFNQDANQWVVTGDMLRGTSGSERHTFELLNQSVLNTSNMPIGTNKDGFVMPYGLTLDPIVDNGLLASLMVPQASGNIFTVDILRNGNTILANKLLINNGENSSINAVTPAAYIENGNVLEAGDLITLSITQVGNGSARGLRVFLTGSRS
ncbi:tail fiber [Xanthomonas virus PB119]|nr:tail fiber [Xanthomonas virus PB119]